MANERKLRERLTEIEAEISRLQAKLRHRRAAIEHALERAGRPGADADRWQQHAANLADVVLLMTTTVTELDTERQDILIQLKEEKDG